MALSVIIVSFNVRDRLRRCLASLGEDAEIIVVDNASNDGSAAGVRAEFPQVRVIDMPSNLGFSAAVNVGAKIAHHDALLILNPDTELAPNTLAKMEMRLASTPNAVAMGFRQVDAHGRLQLSFGPPPSFVLELMRRFVQRRLERGDAHVERLLQRFLSRVRTLPWMSGAALLVRRDAFERIGGFDERFFLYFEDVDFCLRLRAAGGDVVFDPAITLVHIGGESAKSSGSVAQRAYRESQLYFWQKHRGRTAHAIVYASLKLRGLLPLPR